MVDDGGPYHSSGHCAIRDSPCEYFSKGACGICPIGGERSRYIREQAKALAEEGLAELCKANP